MKKQKGFIHISDLDIAAFFIVIGLAGWAIVEFLIWIFSHLSFGIK